LRRLLITIDGPAGAGKTTVSRLLAGRLGYRYIDTGALYRAVALAARDRGIAPEDDAALERMLARLELQFHAGETGLRLTADGRDVTTAIRLPEIAMLASRVSARRPVRAHLLALQRELGREKGAVFEGRDMGTVVFPDADLKFFLSASREARARRRHAELAAAAAAGPEAVDLEEVARQIARRDHQDRTRALAPLEPAPDAITVDSTALSVEEVVARMESIARFRMGS
jgi:cytidylate kinase